MSTPYTIGPNGPTSGSALTAILQPGRPHPPVMIVNTGSSTVYLDSEQQTSSTGGVPLSAGSSIPWDQDLALFAVCPTSGTILLSENTQTPFDAGAIAGQLITQGLAGDIAAAISLVGVPPIDRLTLLDSSGAFTVAYSTPVLDTSSYQSVDLVLSGGVAPDNVLITVSWLDTTGAVVLGRQEFYSGASSVVAGTVATLPVGGPRVQVSYLILAGGGGTSGFKAYLYGSFKTVVPRYQTLSSNSANGTIDGELALGFQTWSGSIPNGAGNVWAWQPGVSAGRTQFALRFTTAGTLTLLIRVPTAIVPLTTFAAESSLAITAGQMLYYDLLLPPAPVEIQLTNLGGAALTFRATMVSEKPF